MSKVKAYKVQMNLTKSLEANVRGFSVLPPRTLVVCSDAKADSSHG